MSFMTINVFDDKILTKKTKRIEVIDNIFLKTVEKMFTTMYNAHGMGLAANQVGLNQSFFIADLSSVNGYEKSKPLVFINPVIIDFSNEETIIEEGCLSLPDLRLDIKRPIEITLEYQDINLKNHKIIVDDLLSRVIQHETDHLNGILFINRIDDEMKKRIKKKLIKIRNRKFEQEYPVTEKPIKK